MPLEPAIRLRKVFVWRSGARPSAPLRAFLDLWTDLPDLPDPPTPVEADAGSILTGS
ncbi:hypothetical protein ACGFNX_42525 [Streptomyces sp. NPDC048723]|uniref:hypothetical protein n=1 Tax=Streptomyces sp. NPDC048723 TaxID=3365589 RepID=UPI0037112CC2